MYFFFIIIVSPKNKLNSFLLSLLYFYFCHIILINIFLNMDFPSDLACNVPYFKSHYTRPIKLHPVKREISNSRWPHLMTETTFHCITISKNKISLPAGWSLLPSNYESRTPMTHLVARIKSVSFYRSHFTNRPKVRWQQLRWIKADNWGVCTPECNLLTITGASN